MTRRPKSVFLGQIGSGGQRQRRGLADGDDMGIRAQMAHELDKVERVILDIELALADRNVAGIVPVGDIDLAIDDQAFHRGSQQRRIVARHRRHQQHLARALAPTRHVEMDQIAEGAFHQRVDPHQMVLAIGVGEGADAPVGFRNHPGECTFRDLAPSGDHLEQWVWKQTRRRIRSESEGRGTQPLVRVPGGFHQIVCRHVAHVLSLIPGSGPCVTFPPAIGVAMLQLRKR